MPSRREPKQKEKADVSTTYSDFLGSVLYCGMIAELWNKLSDVVHHAGEVTHSVSTSFLLSENLYPNPLSPPNYRNTKKATEVKHSKERKAKFKSYPEKTEIYKDASQNIMYWFSSKENKTCSTAQLRPGTERTLLPWKKAVPWETLLVLLNKCIANDTVIVKRKRKASSLWTSGELDSIPASPELRCNTGWTR